mgnify:CR=1 FL=1
MFFSLPLCVTDALEHNANDHRVEQDAGQDLHHERKEAADAAVPVRRARALDAVADGGQRLHRKEEGLGERVDAQLALVRQVVIDAREDQKVQQVHHNAQR